MIETAHAAEEAHIVAAKSFLAKIESAVLFPLMALMMAVALLVFMWGLYEYVLGADDDSARAKGREHMVYGIIGLFILISAYSILKIAAGTFGLSA